MPKCAHIAKKTIAGEHSLAIRRVPGEVVICRLCHILLTGVSGSREGQRAARQVEGGHGSGAMAAQRARMAVENICWNMAAQPGHQGASTRAACQLDGRAHWNMAA